MNTLRFKLAAAILGGSVGLSACGGDDGKPILNPLVGNWVTSCEAEYSDDPETTYSLNKIEVQEDILISRADHFQDSVCTIPLTEISEEAFVYSMEFPEGSIETGLGTAYPVNLTLNSVCEEYPSSCETFINFELKQLYLIKEDRWYVGAANVQDETTDGDSRPIAIDPLNYLTRQ